MDPKTLIPDMQPIPVHWEWIDLLQIVTFTAHFVAMSLVFGSGLICLVQILRNNNMDLAEVLTRRLPTGLAITINLGVAPLLFLQTLYGPFYFTSAILSGGYWLFFVLVVGLAYSFLYIHNAKFNSGRGTLLFLSCSLLFMACAAFLLSSNMSLMINPELWGEYFNRKGGFLNLSDPTLYPRYLHFLGAAPVIGGLGIAVFGRFRRRLDWEKLGLSWFVHAVIFEIFTGVWFLLALPTNIMSWFAGGHIVATFVLVAGTGLALVALGAGLRGKTSLAAIMLFPSAVFMAASRDQLRYISLKPWFQPSELEVTGQIGAPLVFIFFFIIGLGVIYWLAKSWYTINYRKEN